MDKRIAVVAGVLQAGLLVACASDDPEPPGESRGELTIYSSLPLQGDSRPQSEDIVRAFDLALEEHEGRAGGYDIRHVSLDDADSAVGSWTPARVRANAWEAARDPSTIAYLGNFDSGATAVSLPILNDAGILQVSPASTYAGLTRGDGGEPGEPDLYYPSGRRTFARVVPADHVQAGALVSEMKVRECSSAFLVHHDEVYGLGLVDAVERSAPGEGIEIVGRASIGPDALDEVTAAAPDCLVLAGTTADGAAAVANDAGRALPDLRMLFPDACAELAFTEDLDEDVQDRVFVTNPTLDDLHYPSPSERFYRDFREVYGHEPEPYAIYGYETMNLVLDAIDRAGDAAAADQAGRAAVVDALFATKNHESVLGTYDIDEYGDTTLTAYGVSAVIDGALEFDHAVEPVVVEPAAGPEITDPARPPESPR